MDFKSPKEQLESKIQEIKRSVIDDLFFYAPANETSLLKYVSDKNRLLPSGFELDYEKTEDNKFKLFINWSESVGTYDLDEKLLRLND